LQIPFSKNLPSGQLTQTSGFPKAQVLQLLTDLQQVLTGIFDVSSFNS
jgi:hypothetical protein